MLKRKKIFSCQETNNAQLSLEVTGAGTKKFPLNSVVGPGIMGRRLLGSGAEALELWLLGFKTSTYFLAARKKAVRTTL